jgi:polysaccharide export outer membrane protein
MGSATRPLDAQSEASGQSNTKFQGETAQDYNRRLEQLRQLLAQRDPGHQGEEYRIGPEDLLEITVFEAPELNRSVRVSANGEFSLPLIGPVKAAGLTPRELEVVLQELLRRTYMKDPHVGVFVREMQSHPVSVFGAVKKPGVFQIRDAKTLLEVLSMAEGLADDAGDTVLVMRGAGLRGIPIQDDNKQEIGTENSPPAERAGGTITASSSPKELASEDTVEINLKSLLESGDPRFNVPIHPGDIVKVTRAGIVYVVGEVKKPGGFVLKSNENISVLQALALGEGLTHTAAKSHARIIRTDEQTGQRTEIAIDLGKILAGKASDPLLRPKDIVFVPNSSARGALYRGTEAALSIVSGVIVFRR